MSTAEGLLYFSDWLKRHWTDIGHGYTALNSWFVVDNSVKSTTEGATVTRMLA